MADLGRLFETLAFTGGGMATGNIPGAMAQMGLLRQNRQELAFNQELQRQKLEMLQAAAAREAAQAQAMQAIAPRTAATLFPGSPNVQQFLAANPDVLGDIVKQRAAGVSPTSEMQNIGAAGFQPGSPEYEQAMQRRLGLVAAPPEPASFKDATSLRKEYTQQSATWKSTRDAYERMAKSEPTGVGDISLLVGYMKMLDPTSVVREGEFATAANAGGVPDMVRNLYNKAMAGDKLSPELRSSFLSQAAALLDQQRQLQLRREGEYAGMASRANMLKADTIPDFLGEYRKGIQASASPTVKGEGAPVSAAGWTVERIE